MYIYTAAQSAFGERTNGRTRPIIYFRSRAPRVRPARVIDDGSAVQLARGAGYFMNK